MRGTEVVAAGGNAPTDSAWAIGPPDRLFASQLPTIPILTLSLHPTSRFSSPPCYGKVYVQNDHFLVVPWGVAF